MIAKFPKFLNEKEVGYFLNLYKKYPEDYIGEEGIYKFYFVDLMNISIELDKFKKFNFIKFRVQKVNERVNQVKTFHSHRNPWSFVIPLNNNFTGGRLCFKEKVIETNVGDMIYFSGDELHKVEDCKNDRYTLVGFLTNNPMKVTNYNKVAI